MIVPGRDDDPAGLSDAWARSATIWRNSWSSASCTSSSTMMSGPAWSATAKPSRAFIPSE